MILADAARFCRELKDMVRPPRRMAVSEAAETWVRVEAAGGAVNWSRSVTPYMTEPMDLTGSRKHDAVIFCGPARSGKTQGLICGLLAHAVMCDPVGDMLAVFPSEENERKFGKTDMRRLHRYSPEIADMISPRSHDTGITSMVYRNGMAIFLGHPSSAQLAQATYRRVVLSDYDSMVPGIGSEGEVFGLAMKRTTTFLSSGITVAESSPKKYITDPRWVSNDPHEAPPTAGGILPLYNTGTRARWMWRCLHCHEPFEAPPLPSFDTASPVRAAQTAHVPCPHCGAIHHPEQKRDLNAGGYWLHAPGSDGNRVASFWLKGCAAGFQPWGSLAAGYVRGKYRFDTTGDEGMLINSMNVDQGIPYRPVSIGTVRSSDALRERAEDFDRRIVPDGARLVLTAVDVQASRFAASVVAVGPGSEMWIIDRYDIDVAERRTDTGDLTAVDPSAYFDDWLYMHRRTAEMVLRGRDGAEFRPHLVAVDSGGKAGVTAMAYRYWTWARRHGCGHRVMLTKGRDAEATVPRVKESLPDSQRTDRAAKARGEVPVWLMNVTTLKDDLDGALKLEGHGPRRIHWPRWLPLSAYDEMASETRTMKRWEKVVSSARNEQWDLLVMHLAQLARMGVDKWGPNWELAPNFARRPSGTANPQPQRTARVVQPRPSGFARDGWEL